jgi:hypothetical protein
MYLSGAIIALTLQIVLNRLSQPSQSASQTAQTLIDQAQPRYSFDAQLISAAKTWEGRLLFVEQRAYPNYRIAEVSPDQGTLRTVFSVPEGGLIYQIAPADAPDSMLLTYTPPMPTESLYDRNGVYSLGLSNGVLTHWIGADEANVYYGYPVQAGTQLYYTVFQRGTDSRRLERYDTVTRTAAVIQDHATRPTLSPDRTQLAYLRLNAETQARSLWIHPLNGGKPTQLVSDSTFADLDHPLFSPDGKWVYFTVLEAPPPGSKGIHALIGIGARTAKAHGDHNIPARWYRVPVTGGDPDLLMSDLLLIRESQVRGTHLGYISDKGLWLIPLIGDAPLQEVVRSRAIGSFVWLP